MSTHTTSRHSFGVIGCGDIAMSQHLPALKNHSQVAIGAVCDADASKAQAAASQFNVERAYGDHRELLADKQINAVIVATPPWSTPHLVIEALRAGKDVLSEKPMALSVEDARRVADVERETGQLVQIGFTYRHGPLMDALRDWIAQDRLGSPLVIRIGVFDEVWAPDTDPDHYTRLMATLKRGAPCIHDGAHCCDHLHFLTRSRATRISARGLKSRPEFPAPNYNVAHIEFENGDFAKLEIGWFYPQFPRGEFEILGPKGIAHLDREKLESVLTTADGVERVAQDGDRDWFRSCFAVQLEKFLRSIQERSTPVPGTREGLASLELTLAFLQAMQEEKSVALAEA